MGLLNKLFGGGKRVSKETMETRGMHMPDLNLPVDEKFTIHFKKNGGKFIYCDGFEEVTKAIKNIIDENDWQNLPFLVLNPQLEKKFSKENINFTSKVNESNVFFTTCEHLIAQNGSILVCSNQLIEKKINELPGNVIVFATTSQLVESIGRGLKNYKKEVRAQYTGQHHYFKTFFYQQRKILMIS